MSDSPFHVYIMTNKRNTVLYVGSTGRGVARIWEHKTKVNHNSFTNRYHLNKVIYLKEFLSITEAAAFEKVLKGWTRKKKIELINSINPTWKDLLEKGYILDEPGGLQLRSLSPQAKGLGSHKGLGSRDPSPRSPGDSGLRNRESGGRTVVDTLNEHSKIISVEAGQKLTYIVPVLESLPEPRQREIVLAGAGAEADIIGLFLGHGDDVLNLKLDTTHAAPNTRGRTEFKAVLAGRSSLEFNGMIKILKDAQGSHDFLQQDSLMLSEDAKANAVPGLEIEANEVKASHGATAKPVDPEQKFYLMSRGLSEEQAEAMIVSGFIVPILKKIEDLGLRNKVLEVLEKKFSLAHVFA